MSPPATKQWFQNGVYNDYRIACARARGPDQKSDICRNDTQSPMLYSRMRLRLNNTAQWGGYELGPKGLTLTHPKGWTLGSDPPLEAYI